MSYVFFFLPILLLLLIRVSTNTQHTRSICKAYLHDCCTLCVYYKRINICIGRLRTRTRLMPRDLGVEK